MSKVFFQNLLSRLFLFSHCSLISYLFVCLHACGCVCVAPHNVGYRESKQSQPLEAIPVVLHCLQTGNCTAQDSESFPLKLVY